MFKTPTRRYRGSQPDTSTNVPETSEIARETSARSIISRSFNSLKRLATNAGMVTDEGNTDDTVGILDAEKQGEGRIPGIVQVPRRKVSDIYTVRSDCAGSNQDNLEQHPKKRRLNKLPRAAIQKGMPDDEFAVSQIVPRKSDSRKPKVLISGTDVSQPLKTWFKKERVQLVQDVPGCHQHFVCVVRDEEVPTTLKVLRTLVAGKLIVTGAWMADSKTQNSLQNIEHYIHPNVKDIIMLNRKAIFADKTVFFTNQAHKAYNEWPAVEDMLKQAGATSVAFGTAQKGHDLTPKRHVILVGENNQSDQGAMSLLREHGRIVYDKRMIAQSILRAQLDLNSEEFRLKLPLESSTGTRK